MLSTTCKGTYTLVCCLCCRRDTPLGAAFFGSVATPNTVKNILCQAYANDAAVTDELVDCILKPGLEVSIAVQCLCVEGTVHAVKDLWLGPWGFFLGGGGLVLRQLKASMLASMQQ